MSRTVRIIVALLALTLVVPLAACGDDTGDANAAMSRANAQVDTYNALDAELAELLDQASGVDDTVEGVAKALALLDQAAEKVSASIASLEQAEAEMTPMVSMNISDAYKAYANMQIEIVGEYAKVQAMGSELIGLMRAFYEELGKDEPSADELDRLAGEIEAKSVEMDDLAAAITQLETAAAEYFETSGLGGGVPAEK